MSEVPEKLRDAVASHTISAVTARPCVLAWTEDAERRVAWTVNEDGVWSLPEIGMDSAGQPIATWTTPAGFSNRRAAQIVRCTQLPESAQYVFRTPREVLDSWRRAELLLSPAARHAFEPDGIGGCEEGYGLRCVPFRTPTLPPATHTNLCFVGHRDALIVDPATPYPEEQERLFEVYDRWIGRYGPAQAIFLTHHHGDHIGGALALKERFDLAIWAHPETAARVGFSVDRHLEDGESLGPWQVLHTPGHAPGHLCLWNPKTRLLVAGDMVASLGSIVIDPSEGDMRLYLEGLRRLEGLNPRGMVPAHGAFIRNPVGRLAAYQRHRLWREEQVIDALREGTATVSTLTQRAYRDVSTSILWLAERSTLAHLYKLRDEGRASEVSGQWSRVETTT